MDATKATLEQAGFNIKYQEELRRFMTGEIIWGKVW